MRVLYSLLSRRAHLRGLAAAPCARLHAGRAAAAGGFGFFKHSGWGAPAASDPKPEEPPAPLQTSELPAPVKAREPPVQAREFPTPLHRRAPAAQTRDRDQPVRATSKGTGVPRGKDLARLRIAEKIERRMEQQRERETGPQRAPRDEEIKATMVSLVGEDGAQQGIHRLDEVLSSMDRKEHTLVMVDPHSQPPVCRLFQRKILYDREKRARKAKAAQIRTTKVHTIRLRDSIGDHDLEIKCDHLAAFLAKGQRVSISLQKAKRSDGSRIRLIGDRIMKRAEGLCTVAVSPTIDHGQWTVTLQGAHST
ncbi:hypothetical protein H4R19_001835 [Coemansia spiralis]|nr:hypothetical protein H4R19_001835 [Coemansia spiralis]